MEGLDDLEFLSEYREDNRIEAKRAQGGLPTASGRPTPLSLTPWAG